MADISNSILQRGKGFRGQRRIGKCQGNYECSNPRCPILVSTGVKNKHSLKKLEGRNFVFPVKICVSGNHAMPSN